MNLVAFDLAMLTGWASGTPDARPSFGHIKLTPCKGNYGQLVHEFETRTSNLIGSADYIAYEAPIVFDRQNIHVKMITAGLAVHLEYLCHVRGINFFAFMPQVIKETLAGKGNAKKDEMIRAARELGYDVEYHDEADALGAWFTLVGKYDKAHKTGHLSRHLDPLFRSEQ